MPHPKCMLRKWSPNHNVYVMPQSQDNPLDQKECTSPVQWMMDDKEISLQPLFFCTGCAAEFSTLIRDLGFGMMKPYRRE